MRFLLDTNIVIPAEPTSAQHVEVTTPTVVELLSVLSRGAHTAMVHPATRKELAGDRNKERSELRGLLLGKYPELPNPPSIASRLVATLGQPTPGTNSAVDLLLLSAVEGDAVDYFVTEDDGIHRRARRVGLDHRVLTVADAILTVRALFPLVPAPPPFVVPKLAHELNAADPIFDSFRLDYPFDPWLAKCKREHRQAWIIETGAEEYGGISIVKPEYPNDYGIGGKVLKICSFKISDRFRGLRYGELLLKTLFAYLIKNSYDAAFVEMYAKHQELLSLFSDFGFVDLRESPKGERVLLKRLHAPPNDSERLGPLEYHIKYGPNSITLVGARVFVVPIQPKFHRLLFPELEPQLSLATECKPSANCV